MQAVYFWADEQHNKHHFKLGTKRSSGIYLGATIFGHSDDNPYNEQQLNSGLLFWEIDQEDSTIEQGRSWTLLYAEWNHKIAKKFIHIQMEDSWGEL
jgi:hypothetical protein